MKLTMADDWMHYWDKAEQWARQQDWAYYKKDRHASVRAVAIFMANQDGKAIMESGVGRDYEKIS